MQVLALQDKRSLTESVQKFSLLKDAINILVEINAENVSLIINLLEIVVITVKMIKQNAALGMDLMVNVTNVKKDYS